MQAFMATLFPQALPEFLTYTLYRFECALRASAVLGFIGVETIGLGIWRSYENLYYGEVWTQLYALIIVIITVDVIGARLRDRLNRGVVRKRGAERGGESPAEMERKLKRTAPRDWLVRGGVLATGGPGSVRLECRRAAGDGSHVKATERPVGSVRDENSLPSRRARMTSWLHPESASRNSGAIVGRLAPGLGIFGSATGPGHS